jgi:hypothetical protein
VRQLRMWVSSKRQTVSLKSRIYIGACPVEKHLPAEYRSKFTWRQFAGLLKRPAYGEQDVAEVSTALRIRAAARGRAVSAERPGTFAPGSAPQPL